MKNNGAIFFILLGFLLGGALFFHRPTLDVDVTTMDAGPKPPEVAHEKTGPTSTAEDIVSRTLQVEGVEVGVVADSTIAYVRFQGTTAVLRRDLCFSPPGQCWYFNGAPLYACPTSTGWLFDLGPTSPESIAWLESQRSRFEKMMSAANSPVLQKLGVKNPWK